MNEETLWEGERTTLTSLASKGKLTRERYRLTEEYLHFDAGLLSTREEQIPTWSIRDVDLVQGMKQKAMGVGDVVVHCQHDDYTGRPSVTLEGIKDPKSVRGLVMEVANRARIHHQKRSQTTYMNVAGGAVPGAAQAEPLVVAQSEDPLERIGKLKQLLDAGALTQDEFDAQKNKLLGL